MGLLCQFTPADVGFQDTITQYASDGTEVSVEIDYGQACDAFVSTFEQVSKSIVPVDTGYLQSTLEATTDGWECQAITQCEYAQYVEYGTWKQAAQPYFEPAVQEAFSAWMEAANIAITEAQEEASSEIEMIEEAIAAAAEAEAAAQQQMAMTNNFQVQAAMYGYSIGGLTGGMAGNIVGGAFSATNSLIGGAIGAAAGLALFFPIALMSYGLGQSIGLATGSSKDLARDAIPRNERVHGWEAYESSAGGFMPQVEII